MEPHDINGFAHMWRKRSALQLPAAEESMDQSVGTLAWQQMVVKRCSNKPELRVKVWSDGRESLKVLTSEDIFFFYYLFFWGVEGLGVAVWMVCVCRILWVSHSLQWHTHTPNLYARVVQRWHKYIYAQYWSMNTIEEKN